MILSDIEYTMFSVLEKDDLDYLNFEKIEGIINHDLNTLIFALDKITETCMFRGQGLCTENILLQI